MSKKQLSRYSPHRRPKGDKTVVTDVSIDDLVHLLLTSAQLTRGQALSENEVHLTAQAVNRLVSRMRPYYRSRKNMPEDVSLPLLLGEERKYKLSDLVRTVKKIAAQWRESTPSIFGEQKKEEENESGSTGE